MRTERKSAYVPQTISGNNTYFLRLCSFITFTSSATGVVAQFIPTNPNTSGLNNVEYSSISQLYDQVRVRAIRVQLEPTNSTVGTAVPFPSIAMSTSLVNKIAPGSMNLVLDDADGQVRDAQYGSPLEMRWIGRQFPNDILFATVGDEVVTDNAGCPGGVSLYGTGFAISVPALSVVVTTYYQMRNRV